MEWLAAIPPAALIAVVFLVVAVESLGVPLPGETILITTTLLAATSGLNPLWIGVAAASGAIIGDSIGYVIGARYGRRIISVLNRRFPKHVGPKRLGAAVHLMRRWGPWAVFFGRFVAVLRIFSGPLAGMFRMPYPIFLTANAVGGVVWAGLVVTIVTLLGKAATEVLHRFSWAALAIAGVVGLIIAIVVVYRARRRAASGVAADPVVSLTEQELDELLSPDGAAAVRAGVVVNAASAGSVGSGSVGSDSVGSDASADTGASIAPATPRADLRAAVGAVFSPVRWALHRVPVTTVFVTVFIVLGIVSEGLWKPIHTADWFPSVAFGIDSFEAGRWWTLLTGAFITTGPAAYATAIIGAAVFGGWVEYRFGGLRTAVIFFAGHLVGILGAFGIAAALEPTGWEWAHSLTTVLDVGPSCGILAWVATSTAFMRSPYRLRWRLVLVAWVSIALLYIGHISDLEHFLSVVVFVIVARIMVGEHRSTSRPTERDWRLFAVAGLVILGVVQVLITVLPLDGPLGPTTLTQGSWTDVLFDAIAIIVIVNWLRRGHRWAWWAAMALTVLNLLVSVLLIVVTVVTGIPLDFATIWLSTAILWVVQAGLLIASRHAFRVAANQTRRRLPDAIGPAARRARRTAAAIIAEHGGGPLATVALRPESRVFVTEDGAHAIAYQQHGGVALAIGDPIGPDRPVGARAGAIASFAAAAERVGLTPSVFAASAPADAPEGWRVSPLGRDLRVRVQAAGLGAGFGGGAGAGASGDAAVAETVRVLDERAAEHQLRSIVRPLAEQSWEIRSQARALTAVWVTDRHVPELGLTVGGSAGSLRDVARTSAVVDPTGTLLAATTWLPIEGQAGAVVGWSLDLVVRADANANEAGPAAGRTGVGAGSGSGAGPGSSSGSGSSSSSGPGSAASTGASTNDAVRLSILAACRVFAAEGVDVVSFAASGLGQDRTEPDGVAVRTVAGIAARVEPLFGSTDIAEFASSLGAESVPLYLFCREDTDQPRVSYAIARGFLTNGRFGDIANLSGALLVR